MKLLREECFFLGTKVYTTEEEIGTCVDVMNSKSWPFKIKPETEC